MAAAAAAAASLCSRVLVTPYIPPRDVLLWNRDANGWLRIDLGNELEPTVEWLRSTIASRMGMQGFATRVFLGSSHSPLMRDERKRSIEYFTIGQSAVAIAGFVCACCCCVPCDLL